MSMLLPVVIAGGAGSRLWPLSRTHFPKQFLSLISENTLLQDTLLRLSGIQHEPPIIVCNHEHRFLVAEQLRQKSLSHSGIILEPVGRNTAPAIALAALSATAAGEDPLLFVLAADHFIEGIPDFYHSITQAIYQAEQGKLVTFGVTPTTPETGYGYIRRGATCGIDTSTVAAFVEKPNSVTAKLYVNSGDYYWNSGMFLFKASRYLSELEIHCPDVLTACRSAMASVHTDLEFMRIDPDSFALVPDISVDYAVMERTQDAVVVSLKSTWSDVGSWSALWDVQEKDPGGNVVRGDVLLEDTTNSYIYSQDRLVATVGIENIVVVETQDAVLVVNKNNVQQVKMLVNQLQRAGRTEFLQHKEEFRPWGSHVTIAQGGNYQVKKVILKPGERIAKQIHHHRTEHWIIVSGTARVIKGNETFIMTENESTYIPIGISHSIENPGKIPLVLIEIHSGTYLQEDDVVRLDVMDPDK